MLRGTTYKLKVKNPHHVSKGVKSLIVDGKTISGHVVPLFNDGKTHEVEVTLGALEATSHPHAASAPQVPRPSPLEM